MRRRLAKKILGTQDGYYAARHGCKEQPYVEYTLFGKRYMEVPPQMQKDPKVKAAVRRMERYFANDPSEKE